MVVVCKLAAEAVDLIVGPVDGDERGAVNGSADDFAALQVGRVEDLGVQSGLRAVRGYGAHKVAGGDAGEGLELELQRLAGGDAYGTVLERVGGIHGVVLDVEVLESQKAAKVLGFDERREAGAHIEGGVGADREEVVIPPHGGWALLDALAGDVAGHRVIVVADFKRAETEFAHVERLDGVLLAASTTGKRLCERHTIPPRVIMNATAKARSRRI